MKTKKLLIISNAAVTDSESNGRTIKNLINGWDKEKLAQFCTYGNPDLNTVPNCYRVTDSQALKSLLKFRAFGGVVAEKDISQAAGENSSQNRKKVRKTPFSMLLRELVWSLGLLESKSFKNWLDEFNPEAVFVFMGDSSFLLNIAMDIAKKKNIPLFVYSCENYYFKDFNYLTKRKSLFYALMHYKYVKTVKKLSRKAKSFMFISEALMDCYKREFPNISADFIMTASELKDLEIKNGNLITYAGNLGIGRHKALIEIGNALQGIDKSLKISLYGKFPNSQIETETLSCEGIAYKGLVPYSEVVEAIQNSRLLIHTEYNDDFYLKDLKYAFSTKISDCITSGVPFFCYAPKELPFTDFLKKNDCAFVAHNNDELTETLKTALSDKEKRQEKVNNAKKTAEKYFNADKNTEKFRCIVCEM